MENQSEPKISGEIGQGAYGRTLRLKVPSSQAAQWLRSIFRDMATTPTLLLSAQPGIQISDLESLELTRADRRPARHVREDPKGHFIWSGTSEEWETAAQLMNPFVEGEHGHQYMTNEIGGSLEIEISFGETP